MNVDVAIFTARFSNYSARGGVAAERAWRQGCGNETQLENFSDPYRECLLRRLVELTADILF